MSRKLDEEKVTSLTEKSVSYIMQLEELAGLGTEKEMQELSDHIQEVQQEIRKNRYRSSDG